MRPRWMALAALGGSLVPAATLAGEWPQWRGPGRDGISPERNLLKTWPKEGPRLLWQRKELGFGYGSVAGDLQQAQAEPVPLHLRNPVTNLMRQVGYGRGYQYAHDSEEKVTDMTCLPESLAGRTYYRPTDQGFERRLRERMEEIRKLKTRGTPRP